MIKCITQEFYIPMQDALWFSILVPLIAYKIKVKSSYKPNGPEGRSFIISGFCGIKRQGVFLPPLISWQLLLIYLIDFATLTASPNN